EPRLGTGPELGDLPAPRLAMITLQPDELPDCTATAPMLAPEPPPSPPLDRHKGAGPVVSGPTETALSGTGMQALQTRAKALTAVFAARGGMSSNGQIIEVLHFVGGEARCIASQFRRHFLLAGMKGAAAAGILTAIIFLGFSWWSSGNLATPEGDQAAA